MVDGGIEDEGGPYEAGSLTWRAAGDPVGSHAAGRGARLALAYQGPVAPEVTEAFEAIAEDVAGAGLLAITSPDRLHAGWLDAMRARRLGDRAARSHIETILAPLAWSTTTHWQSATWAGC